MEKSGEEGTLGPQVLDDQRSVIRICPDKGARAMLFEVVEEDFCDCSVKQRGEGASLSDARAEVEGCSLLAVVLDVAI